MSTRVRIVAVRSAPGGRVTGERLDGASSQTGGRKLDRSFPNFVILIWSQGWYLTYHYWPTSYNSHIFEGTLYFAPPKTAGERVAHEMAAVSFKEFGLQDANTLEATPSMLESRVVSAFPLNDQEVLCRHLHKVTADWVAEYQKDRVEA
jgi:glycine betaine catabolism A